MARGKRKNRQLPPWLEAVRRRIAPAAARAGDWLGRMGRAYAAVLLIPAEGIPAAVSAGTWTFPLVMMLVCSGWETVLFWMALGALDSEAAVRLLTAVNVLYSFLALVLFLLALSASLWLGCRIFARQNPTLLSAMNCVAVALVPFSALTAGAGMVLFLFRALAFLMGVYAALVAMGYLTEALRSQSDFTSAQALYVIPLMIVAALFLGGLGLLVIRGLLPAGV